MPFFGPIINFLRGMSQGAKITAENLRLEEIIFSYNSPESFLKGLDTCERLVSEVNLIFAEYILEKSKIPSDDVKKVKDLWERVKNIMNEKLRIAEENLDKVYATKLDIAKLIVSVTQLAGEADKEMLVLKENIEQDLNLIHKKIEELRLNINVSEIRNEVNGRIVLLSQELDKAKRELNHGMNLVFNEISQVKQEFEKEMKQKSSEIEKISDNLTLVDSEVKEIKKAFEEKEEEIKEIHKKVENGFEKIKQEIAVLRQETNKKMLMYTVPLYVIAAISLLIIF